MRKHFAYIDYLRFFAMLGIVFLHIASVVINNDHVSFGSFDWELLNILQTFAYSGVAIFFMISGFLLLSDEKTGDLSVLLRKRLPHLYVPLTGWTAVAAVWICHLANDYSLTGVLGHFIKGLYGPIMVHFWFIFSLIVLYAVSPILFFGLNGLSDKGRKYVVILIAVLNLRYILCSVLPENICQYLSFRVLDELEPTGGIVSTFILGWCLGSSKKTVPNWLLATSASFLFACITFGSRIFYINTGIYEPPFHNQTLGFEVLFAACIFMLFKQNIRSKGKLFDWIPIVPLSFPIYFMHVISMELFFGLGWTPHSFLGTVAFAAANTVFCYLLTKTAASIKPICYLAVGMKFSDACRRCNWQHSLKRLKANR